MDICQRLGPLLTSSSPQTQSADRKEDNRNRLLKPYEGWGAEHKAELMAIGKKLSSVSLGSFFPRSVSVQNGFCGPSQKQGDELCDTRDLLQWEN